MEERAVPLMTAQMVASPGGERQAENRVARTYSMGDMVSHAVVFMVLIAPMGIFGSAFAAAGGMVALAYAVGAVVMLVTASSFGILAQAYQAAGSVYTYAGRAIAAWVGWLAGWMLQLDYIMVPPLLSLVAASSMAAFVPGLPRWAWIVAFVLVNTVINLRGPRRPEPRTRCSWPCRRWCWPSSW
jgi:amino acid transporter